MSNRRAGAPDTLDRLRIGTPTVLPAPGDLSVSGNATIGGSVTASGNQTISGNLAVTGTLTVAGAANLAGGVTVTGGSVFNNGLVLSGNPTPSLQTVAFGKEVDARAKATGRGTIAFPGTTNISTAAFLRFYSGTEAFVVPAFSMLYSV